MTDFAVYKEQAVTLPQQLAQACSPSTSAPSTSAMFHSFFARCLPASAEISMQTYARLIMLTAQVLDVEARDDAEKICILKGMYCYVFIEHDSALGWVNSRPLLLLLQERLGITSPSQLPDDERRQLFAALGAWCDALFQSVAPETQEIRSLKSIIPANMRASVFAMETVASVGRYSSGLPAPSECVTLAQESFSAGMRSLFS
ncbi:hypothetical protein Lgee_1538 [Legionella geestiana]|uniref:Uncharacterized protein n=1 Tax=Legionella geestiana TaxID=45065 RepID=A0A0W0TS55_9GAMM|nr:hypothetical protein [Legionella geestiana]KTC98461.1 hypothetical protein Lgee_1538 [Legionella geestiana]QBS13133.1 hypothetical protein E4T54_10500 [Legionella geestiana]QDQ39186.1 hypothetical protein E3226_001560 [Legionella geestiana]STX54350.1 Uncharacterised protein [Legionella geestiana]